MKSSNYFLLFLFIVSCQPKRPELLLSQWNKSADAPKYIERKLASGPSEQCLKDQFTVDVLRAEVLELEKKFTQAPKVKGRWRHLNLEDLPVPQANFLKSYGDKLGDLKNNSIDFSRCTDVLCLFNKIYRQEDGLPGLVHYLWFLKFGFMLSADNKVPDQRSDTPGFFNQREHSLDKYLLQDKELFGLWRLSIMLKPPFTNLNYLKEMQMIPRGEKFEGEEYATSCGIASSSGTIVLTDNCLSINGENWDQGYLYHAVTHELAHHVDFEQGRGSRDFFRSYKEDYLNLSGFLFKEFVDPKTGKTVNKWEIRQNSKHPSEYAKNDPSENFAESLALFRVEGDRTKESISAQHYAFVSTNYFDGLSFERETLVRSWIEKYKKDLERSVFQAFVECSQSDHTTQSTFFQAKDFTVPVSKAMLGCMGNRASELSSLIKAKAKLYEPEGCLAINSSDMRPRWSSMIKEVLIPLFNQHLNKLSQDKNYLQYYKQYLKQLSDKTLASRAYLSCYKRPDEARCYQEEVLKLATERGRELNVPQDQIQELAQTYVSYYLFETTKEEVLQSYREMVFGHLQLVKDEATKTWQSCKGLDHNDEQSPSGAHFTLSDGYMISSFYNCLNATIPESLKETVRLISFEGVKLQDAQEEMILLKEVRPHFISTLNDIYKKERAEEHLKAKTLIEKDQGKIRSSLLSDFSWIKSIMNSADIKKDCTEEALRQIPLKTLYHLKKELFREYVSETSCFDVTASLQFNNWLNHSKEGLLGGILEGVEKKLLIQAQAIAQDCLKKYPKDTALDRIRWKAQREGCLVDEWPRLENEVVETAVNDPVVTKLKVSKELLRSHIEKNRRRLQLRIIKDFFN
jgi:hypothetical protein